MFKKMNVCALKNVGVRDCGRPASSYVVGCNILNGMVKKQSSVWNRLNFSMTASTSIEIFKRFHIKNQTHVHVPPMARFPVSKTETSNPFSVNRLPQESPAMPLKENEKAKSKMNSPTNDCNTWFPVVRFCHNTQESA